MGDTFVTGIAVHVSSHSIIGVPFILVYSSDYIIVFDKQREPIIIGCHLDRGVSGQ